MFSTKISIIRVLAFFSPYCVKATHLGGHLVTNDHTDIVLPFPLGNVRKENCLNVHPFKHMYTGGELNNY